MVHVRWPNALSCVMPKSMLGARRCARIHVPCRQVFRRSAADVRRTIRGQAGRQLDRSEETNDGTSWTPTISWALTNLSLWSAIATREAPMSATTPTIQKVRRDFMVSPVCFAASAETGDRGEVGCAEGEEVTHPARTRDQGCSLRPAERQAISYRGRRATIETMVENGPGLASGAG